MRALSSSQCRAARALLDWTQQELADRARVARATIRDFETGRHHLHRSTETLVLKVLEDAGVVLVSTPDLGEGACLRASAPTARARTR